MTQREVENIALRTRICILPQTPPNLHSCALLVTQRVYLPSLDEDDLVFAVFAVVYTV